MKKICVITGASSGIGKEFFMQLKDRPDWDEIWVIARNAEKLNDLCALTGTPVRPISLDLSEDSARQAYAELLTREKPEIVLLINGAGYGKFASTQKVGYDATMNMIDLNVKAVAALSLLSLPYMKAGDGIINIASVAAYQPIPYINVYGATKAFVLNFTRALGAEMKHSGIRVMAVCPFWTKTGFFDRAITPDEEPVVKKYVAMYKPEQIVRRALTDYQKGRAVSLFGFVTKAQLLGVKLLPTSATMQIWMRQQKLTKR